VLEVLPRGDRVPDGRSRPNSASRLDHKTIILRSPLVDLVTGRTGYLRWVAQGSIASPSGQYQLPVTAAPPSHGKAIRLEGYQR
jgi:hypothetical protein